MGKNFVNKQVEGVKFMVFQMDFKRSNDTKEATGLERELTIALAPTRNKRNGWMCYFLLQ